MPLPIEQEQLSAAQGCEALGPSPQDEWCMVHRTLQGEEPSVRIF